MRLTPREIDKLMLHQAAVVAQKRYARGLRLNHPETVALLSAQLMEFIRDGDRVSELMDKGKRLLGFDEVMDGVPTLVHEIQVEGTFPDGTKLVTVHEPICRPAGEPKLALYGSGLKRREAPITKRLELVPGEVVTATGNLALNEGRKRIQVKVTHMGDRPVQVGSHYPFFEVNPDLEFPRAETFGFRLDIPSGTAVRFEPGDVKEVTLVEIGGEKKVYGGNGLISGNLEEENRQAALKKARAGGFRGA